jgi:4-amino-4-deoxy-L-arabinose transferase-like glycosyltransferase
VKTQTTEPPASGLSQPGPGPVREPLSPTVWWAVVITVVWTVANVVWVNVQRNARLWDHEENAYVLTSAQFVEFTTVGDAWADLVGTHVGPLQRLVSAVPQTLFGVDEATLLWQNVGFTALTGLLVFVIVRRLSDGWGGVVACASVLLASGMVENARGVLTMVPATTFLVLALLALAEGRGLGSLRWAAVLGAAVAGLVLSRPMAVVFVPALALPAVLWSRFAGVPRRQMLEAAAVSIGVAVALSCWWLVFTYEKIYSYLTVGAPGIATDGPLGVLNNRISELRYYVDPLFPLWAPEGPLRVLWMFIPSVVVVYLLLRWTGHRGEVPSTGAQAPLPLLPIWLSVVGSLLLTLVSSTFGLLLLPLVPLMFVAGFAGARRRLDGRGWRIWSAFVLIPAVLGTVVSSTVTSKPGNRFTWCQEVIFVTTACAVRSADDAAVWRRDLQSVTDSVATASAALDAAGRPPRVAFAVRDHILTEPAIRLRLWFDHRLALPSQFLGVNLPRQEQFDQVVRDAQLVVVAPDSEPVVLMPSMYDPDELAERLPRVGFVECTATEFPDGRTVQVFIRTPVVEGACP